MGNLRKCAGKRCPAVFSYTKGANINIVMLLF